VQHGGVLAGMILVALLGATGLGRPRGMTIGGCLAAALGAASLTVGAAAPHGFPLQAACFVMGLANGVFAASAIAAMMSLAGEGRGGREGVRLGLWGAAQAIAFGLGGLVGTVVVDVARWALGSAPAAYGLAFAGDAALFVVSAALALGIGRTVTATGPRTAHAAAASGD
jgi:BCD family chlorophyll transporter-like MFS transporter